MPKTVVGLFENAGIVAQTVREIEALGFPLQEVRSVKEPAGFDVTGVMSFPRLDFEVELSRDLTKIGATVREAQAYVDGLRRGGALAFATGPDEKVEAAANIMNLRGAVNVETVNGAEPRFPAAVHPNVTPIRDSSVMAGRIRQSGGGACFFVW